MRTAPAAAREARVRVPAAPIDAVVAPDPSRSPVSPAMTLDMNTLAATIAAALATHQSPALFDERLAAEQLSLVSGFDRLLALENLGAFTPLPHQIEAVRRALRVLRGRALLADEVGLGKTIEAGLVAREYWLRGLARRILVLAPPALVAQWSEEMHEKLGLDFATTRDPAFRDDPQRFLAERSLIVASLATARGRLHSERFLARPWDLVIVDEAHHLKNRGTRGHELVSALEKRYLLLLTATPVENDLLELYHLITLLKPGQLGTPAEFKRRFAAAGGTRVRDEGRLRDLLREVMVRNTRAASGVTLPRRRAETVIVRPSESERVLYDAVTRFVREETAEPSDPSGGGPRLAPILLRMLQAEVGSSPQALVRTIEHLLAGEDLDTDAEGDAPAKRLSARHRRELSALAAGARTIGSTTKEARLLSLIRAAGEQAVVFTKHRATLDALADALARAGIPYSAYHGGLPPAEKDREIEAFRAGRQILLSTESGGEGRNLQFCRTLVNYDLPWNPMQIEQRIGRLHRIGQTREVRIISLASEGSIEDHLLRVLDRKLKMFELVVGEMDLVLGRLQDDRDFASLVFDLFAGAPGEAERTTAFDDLGERLLEARRGYEDVKVLEEKLFGDDFSNV